MSALTIVALGLAVLVYIGGVLFHTGVLFERPLKISRGLWLFAIFWPVGESLMYLVAAILYPFGSKPQE